jgi:valyl-tRNA synthetase
MVMMGLFNMDERPFDDVYIHGTVLDETGTKMSKSLKNGIDPLVMIDGGAMEYHPGGVHKTPESEDYACPGYGADAVRYTLLDMTTEGQDLKLAPSRFEAGRNFANKVFNAGRFVLMNLHERPLAKLPSNDDLLQLPLGFEEQWLLDRLQSAVDACQDALTRWRFSDYVNQAYRFFRDDLCDWYLEWAKHQFKAGGQAADTAAAVLAHSFEASLRLLHPGMPFLTEYLWQELKNVSGDSAWSDSFLMTTAWPEADNRLRRDGAAEAMADLQALVSGIRQTRNEIGLPDKTRLPVTIAAPSDAGKAATWHEALAFLCDRSNAEITIGTIDDALLAEPSVSAAVGDTAVRVQFSGDIKDQLGGFIKRLEKQLQAKEKGAAGKRGRLSNEKYLAGAPPEKVQETRDMLAQDEAEIAQLQATLAALT